MYNLIKLQNGLRVIVENISYVNSVSVGLWVGNGSRNENSINNGISHFIEHMFFKGTSKRNSKELSECIENVGGQLNAFTGKESTCYYAKVLDSHLDLALDVLSDMLFNSKFTSEDIEKEKGVVIEEINMSEDNPEDVLADLQCEAAWGENSMALPILGSISTVKGFNREDIVDYISNHYTPENSVISIAGKIDIDTISQLIEKYFGGWKNRTNTEILKDKPRLLNNVLYRNKKIEQLHLSVGIKGTNIGADDLYPLLLLNNILGGGASSILFQKIREEMGICYSVYSYLSTYKDHGMITVYAGLNPSYGMETLNVIKSELDNFVENGISDERLSIAKEQVKGSYILGLESTSSRMFSNGKSVLFLNKVNSPEEVIHKIDSIDSNKINSVLFKTFGTGIKNVALVGSNFNLNKMKPIIEKEIITSNDF